MGGHLYPSTTSQGLATLATFISSVNIAGMMSVKGLRGLFSMETYKANINQYKIDIIVPLKKVSLRP